VELFLLLLKTVVLGLRTSQVALTLVSIALLAALVYRGQDTEDALGRAGSAGTHGDYTPTQDSVGSRMATKGTKGKVFTSRHNTLRKASSRDEN
jgi:hypothetical protein